VLKEFLIHQLRLACLLDAIAAATEGDLIDVTADNCVCGGKSPG
jgi:hypothetical protein